jgi:hypothetical protein
MKTTQNTREVESNGLQGENLRTNDPLDVDFRKSARLNKKIRLRAFGLCGCSLFIDGCGSCNQFFGIASLQVASPIIR